MSHVAVTGSPNGTGVVVYDTNGTNTISHSKFSHNGVSKGSDHPGGGGFYIEFTYCKPGALSCDTATTERNKGALYTFTGCEFSENQADDIDREGEFTYIIPYKTDHQSFGRGGGLSFYARGDASGIKLTVKDSIFSKNIAEWGGGLLVELHDNAHDNVIEINDTKFYDNRCPFSLSAGTAGGGIRMALYIYGLDGLVPKTAKRNEVIVDNCEFLNNSALHGAGISVSWSLQSVLAEQVARVHILNSKFKKNYGKLGSAVHVDRFWMISQGLMMTVWIENCHFDSNSNRYYLLLEDVRVKPVQMGLGTVCITSSNVSFRGNTTFISNRGSSVAVTSGTASFVNANALFANNFANKGAGILVLGASSIELGNGTRMLFRNNSVMTKGGAIHNVQISRENLKTDAKCFLRYVDPFIAPDNWNVTINFVNNWDHGRASRNAIFSTSIYPCSILGGSGIVTNRSRIFCWKGWNYYNASVDEGPMECESQISTAIGNMEYSGEDDYRVKTFPGWEFKFPVTVHDDLNKDITEESLFMLNELGNFSLTYQQTAMLFGNEDSYQFSLENLDERVWYANISVDLLTCPPGFKNENGSCVCTNNYGGYLQCDQNLRQAVVKYKTWMGKFNGSGDYYVSQCPPVYCRDYSLNRSIQLPNSSEALNDVLCAANRKGVMCGECVEGFGPAVNGYSYDCINCTDINLAANAAKYLASIYLPLVVLFAILIVFDIRLTTGPANAFILYSQLVSSTFGLNADGEIPLGKLTPGYYKKFIGAYLYPYGIFNLEFIENCIEPFCLSTSFNTLTVLSLDYCIAFSPLIMIILILIVFKVKELCMHCRKLKSKSPKFLRRRTTTIGQSLLPAFASFLLLSYTKLCMTSAYLITLRPIMDESGNKLYRIYLAGQFSYHDKCYLPYLISAIVIFFTFIIIPPLFLLDYPLRALEWLILKSRHVQRFYPIVKIRILLDTFQGCYKNKTRFFAGLYFLFRLLLNMLYSFCDTWLKQFVIQQIACSLMVMLLALYQPYKRQYLNYVDILIFSNLSILNCLNLYVYVTFKYEDLNQEFVSAVQYILVFLPLLYIVIYVLWCKTKRYHLWMKENVCEKIFRPWRALSRSKQLDTMVRDDLSASYTPIHRSETESFFERARNVNTYRPRVVPVTQVLGVHDCEGDASVYQESSPCIGGRREGVKSPLNTETSGSTYGSTTNTSSAGDTGNQ